MAASPPATYLGGLIRPPTNPGSIINVPASPPSQHATTSPKGPAPTTATSPPEPAAARQDPFQYAMQLPHSPPISGFVPAYYSPSSEPTASPWGSMGLPMPSSSPPLMQPLLSGVPTPPSLLPMPHPVMGLPMVQPQIMQQPIMQPPLSGVPATHSMMTMPLSLQRAAMEQTMVYTVPTISPRAPANPPMPPDLLPVSKPRKIDFEPGKSAGTDEEGPVLQRKQTNVQRAAPPPAGKKTPPKPGTDSDEEGTVLQRKRTNVQRAAPQPPPSAPQPPPPPRPVPDEESAALPIGTVERISSLQSGYNTTSQEAILSTVARDLEMRSGRIIQLKDREQIGQPVPEPVQRSARNGDFQREADAMAVALANAFPPEAVVPAPTEHYTPRMKLTCWQADKLAAEFLHSRRPERLHWNVCEPPSLLPSQPPSLSLPTFNPDIHPAYAAPPPPAFNPDIHAAYAAPPMEVEKLQPAAPKVSPGKEALSLSDVDDGVWGLSLYDMPAGWGATGIKFWGTPKKELKITGFLQGTAARQSDLSIGDTIVGVDGESVEHLEPKAIVLKIAGIYKTEVVVETRRGVKARIPRDVTADQLRNASPTKK